MKHFLFVGALCAVLALPSEPMAVGPRGGGGGGRSAPRPQSRPSPSVSRPQPRTTHTPQQRPQSHPQPSRATMGPSRPAAQRPSAPAARPNPGAMNRPAQRPSPSVTRPSTMPSRPAVQRPASPQARPAPGISRPSQPGGASGVVPRPGGATRPTTPIVNRPAPGIATRPGAGAGGVQRPQPQPLPSRPGAGGGGVQRPGQGIATRPGAGGGGIQRPDTLPARPGAGGGGIQRPDTLPARPGAGGGGIQRPDLRPSRPGEGGGGIQRPDTLPARPGAGGGGIQRPDLRPSRPGEGGGGIERPGLLPSRPGQGGSGEQWRPDRPDTRPWRPGEGGSGEQWRPDRPLRPEVRPDRPINIGDRNINNINNISNTNLNYSNWANYGNSFNKYGGQWGGYRPWYGSPGYWNTPFYGGMSAYYWSRPWSNYHYGWHNGYWNSFATQPSFWLGLASGSAVSSGDSFAYSNPYYAAPPPQSDTTIVVNAPDYSAPIPPPTTEQRVIAYVEAPEPVATESGQVTLPTTAPPAPPKDETAMDANGLFDKARELFKAQKFAEAQAEVEKAIQLLPSDAALHEFRALTLFAQAKYKDAAAALYAVLAAGPGWNWETMSALYGDPAEYTRELRVLEDFSKANPDADYAHFLRAYHYLVLGDKDSAVAQFKEVVRIQPNDKLSSELVKALTTPPKNGATPPAAGR